MGLQDPNATIQEVYLKIHLLKEKLKKTEEEEKTHKQTNVDDINYTNLSAQQRILNSIIINIYI